MDENSKMEKLPQALAFDLDGTLTPSKSHLEADMAEVLGKLLKYLPIAVISGASKAQFEEQFLNYLKQFSLESEKNFANLYLFPENGAELIEYKEGKWIVDYEKKLNKESEKEIISALEKAISKFSLKENHGNSAREDYGELIEDRGEQITLSALGQKAPLEIKEKWDPDQDKRKEIKAFLDSILKGYEIRIGGATSIDITKKGINKAFGMRYFAKNIGINEENIMYFGDALYADGNDEIVKETEIICIPVHNPQETIVLIRDILYRYEQTSNK
jgi:HAD superfamily hydrolase (TIGR01484 family)